jgi:hypothetical protein
MSQDLSVVQMLADLRKQARYHREQEAQHAEQEELHREKRAFHATEGKAAEERCESLESALASASEQVKRHQAASAAPAPSREGLPQFNKRPVGPLVNRVIASYLPDATFSPEDVAREVNRHFASILRKPVDARAVSVPLRRLAANGRLYTVRAGTPYHGALYSRTKPSADKK